MEDLPKTPKQLPFFFIIIVLVLLAIVIILGIYSLRPIEKKVISNKTTPTPTKTVTFLDLINNRDRNGIRNYFQDKSITEINNTVEQLTADQKTNLINAILLVDGESPQKTKELSRQKIITILNEILSKKDLGFYAEILSYTAVNIEGNAFTATCNQVNLSPDFNNYPINLARDFLMHETMHSFNCVNGIPGAGHSGALDEGSAIWIFKAAFPEGRNPDELTGGWAETTYGTVNYYRDIGVTGYPREIPLLAAENAGAKLNAVFTWLSATDPSKLAWNSQNKLTFCYNKYYKNFNRDIDFQLWLKEASQKSKLLAKDPSCN